MTFESSSYKVIPASSSAASKKRVSHSSARRCRRKFLRFYPKGFKDQDYIDLERTYKWNAHRQWQQLLGRAVYADLLDSGAYVEIARRAVQIESRTNLLFSFEKMALRDAVRTGAAAKQFARGLYDYVYGETVRSLKARQFARWCEVVEALPRRQTRVLTWPIVTVFGFIATPRAHIYLKPTVTRTAARNYGFDFDYQSRPNWTTYASLLSFAAIVRADLRDLRPRDMIDLQSFIWVQGSAEYEE